jgi:hypothetical protein
VPHDVHDFEQQKQFAESVRSESFWAEVYKRAFPDMTTSYLNRRNNGAQRAGIDRVIVLRSTKVLRIDEKLRRDVRDDILLEYLSNDRTGALGWMEKDLMIDYLAYAMLPAQRCYLFPWDMLRRAWLAHRDDWIERGKRGLDGFKCPPPAQNRGYATHSVCVPTAVLRRTVARAGVIQLDAPDGPAGPAMGPSDGLKPLAFNRDDGAQQKLNFGVTSGLGKGHR